MRSAGRGPGPSAPRASRGRARARAGPPATRLARRRPTRPRFLALAGLVLLLTGCSPVYVFKAGVAEARILAARRPIPEMMTDPETDPDVRGKLAYVWEARRFAADSLRLRVGDQYTSFSRVRSDTLALVLSGAPADALRPLTWWFPIVGHLPYRAYFDYEEAREERAGMEVAGYDTYLRPTAAFSTLGWFADPLLSTVLRAGTGSVVETVLHELAHTHLFVPGHVRFNESFANWVGSTGRIAFFCGRKGSGPRSVKCLRARAAWQDDIRFSRFLDEVVTDLEALYADDSLAREAMLARKEEILTGAQERFREEVLPELRYQRYSFFTDLPLNNATLLARMRYYHRLGDFAAYQEERGGDLARALEDLEEGVRAMEDPWEVLPERTPGAVATAARQGAGRMIPAAPRSDSRLRCTLPARPVG